MKTRITNELFADFLACRYKAYLKLNGKSGHRTEFSEFEDRLLRDYRARARRHLLESHREAKVGTGCASLADVLRKQCDIATDVRVDEGDVSVHFDALVRPSRSPSGSQPDYIPVMFTYHEKPGREHNLLLGFCGLVLALQQETGPRFGRLVHGIRFRSRRIKFDSLLDTARDSLKQIRALNQANNPPALHLNAHCAACEFKDNCRADALNRDDLGLLQGIKEKEIIKLNNRGVFTVTQLSYTFRPRKRSRRSNPKTTNYYHSLKALAIRDQTIYVAGKPTLNIIGTPVYLDVEGIPDQDFYYLVGLRVGKSNSCYHRSFWANDRSEEEQVWRGCLGALAGIDTPQLFHYGSYETTFLKRMKKRYTPKGKEVQVLDELIDGAHNALSVIYGHIYFPTYSNGLKDIAGFLGFAWSADNPSGRNSLLLRHRWQLTRSESVKQQLITYNAEDCEALERVIKTVIQLIPAEDPSSTALLHPNAVYADSLKPQRPYGWGPIEFALPEFDHINKCAYWDYQRDRIYVRSSTRLKSVERRKRTRRKRALRVNKTVRPSRPWKCPRCDAGNIGKTGRHSKLLYDLKFFDGGVKKWVTKYLIDHYKCRNCGNTFPSDEYDWTRHRYGSELLAYVIYCNIELHMPQLRIAQSMKRFFGYSIPQSGINRSKARAAELYLETHEAIRQKLVEGGLIHADETKFRTKTKAGYVWVFTSLEEVMYVWSETREGDIARDFLGGFQGVLVSDFYSGYDSIDCPQQKCLIHLIRDLNDDLLKEPFNEEMKGLVHDFAALLKPIVGTIERFGLKKRFLRKHKVEVKRFCGSLLGRDYTTETASKAQDRFRRNRDKLFTFLDHDGVTWNNNNAERAIKAFSSLRDVIQGTTNERGIREYLVLLSICETCEYKGVSFLDFLRSGERQIDEYAREHQ